MMQSSRVVAMAGVVAVLLATVASGAVVSGSGGGSAADENLLKVSATASSELFVPTSLAEVSLSISIERKVGSGASDREANDSSASEIGGGSVGEQALVLAGIEANAELARRANQLITLLKEARVGKLRTTSASLDQIYDYPPNQPARQIGVRAQEGLSFRTNLTLVGQLLTSIVQAGATRIDGVSFVAADEEIERVTLAAIRLAVQKAKLRASVALHEGGCEGTIGVRELSLSTPGGGQPVFFANHVLLAKAATAATAAGAAPRAFPVVGGDNSISVQASVTLQCQPLTDTRGSHH